MDEWDPWKEIIMALRDHHLKEIIIALRDHHLSYFTTSAFSFQPNIYIYIYMLQNKFSILESINKKF